VVKRKRRREGCGALYCNNNISIHYFSKKKGDGVGKDSLMKDAIATAKLWESRFHATDRSRKEYW